jgi:large exoprotein involved in heme utilization and adhesion
LPGEVRSRASSITLDDCSGPTPRQHRDTVQTTGGSAQPATDTGQGSPRPVGGRGTSTGGDVGSCADRSAHGKSFETLRLRALRAGSRW